MDLRPRDHVTQALQELHGLPIVQRIDYKLCLLVYKSRTGCAPVYLSDMLTPAADITSRAMRSSTNSNYFVRRSTLRHGDRAFSVAAPSLESAAIRTEDDNMLDRNFQDASKLFYLILLLVLIRH